MEEKAAKVTTVDEYIAQCPANVQEILQKIRAVIREAAPEAEERIGYGIPAYHQNGPVIYFAGYARHVSIHPTPSGAEAFAEEVARYQKGKGTLQFPINEPIPYDLIRRLTVYRLAEDQKRKPARRKKDAD